LQCTAAIGVGIQPVTLVTPTSTSINRRTTPSLSRSFAEKKGLNEEDPDDIPGIDAVIFMREREWKKKKSPPLPIKEWASLFLNLRLTNSSVQDSKQLKAIHQTGE